MKHIFFFLSSQEYVRNYLQSGVIESLTTNYQITLVISSGIKMNSDIHPPMSVITFESIPNRFDLRNFINDVSTWKLRDNSKSFRYRHDRLHPTISFLFRRLMLKLKNLNRSDSERSSIPSETFNSALTKNYKTLYYLVRGYVIKICSTRLIYPLLLKLAVLDKIRHKGLLNLVSTFKPDLIIFPTSGYESLYYEFLAIAKQLHIPSYSIVDNWDNLSSKTVLLRKPDYVGVWGRQSKEHAVRIQGFSESQVFVIGSARFSVYEGLPVSEPRISRFPYVLFTGSFLYFDEQKVLDSIVSEIETHSESYGDLKILYRPHPRGSHISNSAKSFSGRIVLDSGFDSLDGDFDIREIGNHPLIHYQRAISQAEFVISGLTSMLLEAVVNKKHCIVTDFEEENNFTSPKNVYNNYEHFDGIKDIELIHVCEDFQSLGQTFREIYYKSTMSFVNPTTPNSNYFVEFSHLNYQTRLLATVNDILASKGLAL